MHDPKNPEGAKAFKSKKNAVKGNIVVIVIGSAGVTQAAQNAQNAGAAGCLFVSTEAGKAVYTMKKPRDGSDSGLEVHIANITMRDGSSLLRLIGTAKKGDEITCAVFADGGDECLLERFETDENQDYLEIGGFDETTNPGLDAFLTGKPEYSVRTSSDTVPSHRLFYLALVGSPPVDDGSAVPPPPLLPKK